MHKKISQRLSLLIVLTMIFINLFSFTMPSVVNAVNTNRHTMDDLGRIIENEAPSISNVENVSLSLLSNEITIEARITDSPYNNLEASLFYGYSEDGTSFDVSKEVNMTSDGYDTFSVSITPPQAGKFYYYIKVAEGEKDITYPKDITDLSSMKIDIVDPNESINTIQRARDSSDNDIVITRGIVTALDGSKGFYIRDDSAEIHVYIINNPGIEEGDDLIVRGIRDTFFGLDQLKSSSRDIRILSEGNEIPESRQ